MQGRENRQVLLVKEHEISASLSGTSADARETHLAFSSISGSRLTRLEPSGRPSARFAWAAMASKHAAEQITSCSAHLGKMTWVKASE